MPDFSIRERVKYDKEWDWEETRAWMKEVDERFIVTTQEAWTENITKGNKRDYDEYKTKQQFADLEECIAINLFGITPEMAKRAWKGTSILRYFEKGQRRLAAKARQKMEKIAGRKDCIEVQVIPIATRMDEDLTRKEGEDDKEQLLKENKNTGKIYVYRVKDSKGNPVWLDGNLREYRTWQDYLTGNKSPQCIYCYPKDGFLLKKITDLLETSYAVNEVEFGEPPSCNLLNRMKGALDTVIVVASPIIAIGTFFCPATWTWTATLAGAASQGLFCYNLAMHGYQVYDQINHGEDYGASLMSFITSIGTMLVNNGLSKYLHGVALENRPLTTMKSLVITGFLLGMKGAQVASWTWMTLRLACKPKLEPMDVVSYVVACHNLYSCVVSPWSAEKLLTKVKNEVQAEYLKAVEKKDKEVTKEKAELDTNQAKLTRLRADSGADPEAIAQTERDIQKGEEKIQQLEGKILTNQEAFLDNKGKWMEHEGAREEYNKFRKNAFVDPEQLGTNTRIDQNGRIIKSVTYMDAEMVFKMVSITGSKIQFSNGQTIDLLINSQLDIHPRAIEQMNRVAEGRNEKDLKKVMELTRDYTASTQDGYQGSRTVAMDTYLRDIKPWLKNYQMITRIEITAEQREQQYSMTEKNDLIKDEILGYFSNHKKKFISQDGSHTIYNDGRGYFGVTMCDYDADLGREVGKPRVATHYPKKIGAPPAPAAPNVPAPNPPAPPAQNSNR